MTDLVGGALLLLGSCLFAVGSVGLLRLPDLCCRLHALTKVDNPGLGLIVVGFSLLQGDLRLGIKSLLVWLLVMITSAAVAHLIARQALLKESQ